MKNTPRLFFIIFHSSSPISMSEILLKPKNYLELCLEKNQVDKIQNGRPSAIIHLDRPDIAEYHENRSR